MTDVTIHDCGGLIAREAGAGLEDYKLGRAINGIFSCAFRSFKTIMDEVSVTRGGQEIII